MNRPVLQWLAWSLCLLLAAPAGAQKSAGEAVDDAYIAATLKASLLDHKDTDGTRINVESVRGVVQLSGFVSSEAEKATAERLARATPGVRQVINSLAVAAGTSIGTRLDDSLITGQVKAALMDAADVSSLQINVETRDGVTQLAGFVTSSAMKSRAEQVAAGVPGVKRVDNALQVRRQ
jgi:hyperosmotically inducible periplasmic protein